MGGLKTALGTNLGQMLAMAPQISTLVSTLCSDIAYLSLYVFPNSVRFLLVGLDQWYPTWANGSSRGMTVKSVKMWQQGTCAN